MQKRVRDFLNLVLKEFSVQGILFTNLVNIRYLTGFSGSDGFFIWEKDKGVFFTDFRYEEQVSTEVSRVKKIIYNNKWDELRDYLSSKKVKRLGFEPKSLNFSDYSSLKKLLKGVKLIPLKKGVEELRIVKSADEVEKIKSAIKISEESFLDVIKMIRPGVSEIDVATELEHKARRLGSATVPFETIVASGKRGALPHGKASEKRIRKGEMVIIDFGVNFLGYHSDITVTLAIGEPGEEMRKIYQVVSDAQKSALEIIREGVEARAIDARAREFIERRGYGKFFRHALGHGVGLEVHEEPAINFRNGKELKEGMVFTVEPGIYLPKIGGVRIEDMVLVKRGGYELLTRSNGPLIVL